MLGFPVHGLKRFGCEGRHTIPQPPRTEHVKRERGSSPRSLFHCSYAVAVRLIVRPPLTTNPGPTPNRHNERAIAT